MKAIRMRIQKSSRPFAILLTSVVAIITTMVVANATQTITTPNATSISYNLAPLAISPVITPVTNKPVLVTGCSATSGDQGLGGLITLFHIPSTSIQWAGWELVSGSPSLGGSTSATPGIHILWVDANHFVDIEVASADTIRLHNHSSTSTLAGNVTLIW